MSGLWKRIPVKGNSPSGRVSVPSLSR